VNTSKKRKLVFSILGLGLVALVFDKAVLGGGATPALAAEDDAGASLTVPASERSSPAPRRGDMRSVTEQLATMAGRLDLESLPLEDAFAPPRSLTASIEAELAEELQAQQHKLAAEQAATLREQLKLTATSTSGRERARAMVNGTLYKLGETVAGTGFRINAILTDHILLEDQATKAVVRLELNP